MRAAETMRKQDASLGKVPHSLVRRRRGGLRVPVSDRRSVRRGRGDSLRRGQPGGGGRAGGGGGVGGPGEAAWLAGRAARSSAAVRAPWARPERGSELGRRYRQRVKPYFGREREIRPAAWLWDSFCLV